jgi:hypothetical protein
MKQVNSKTPKSPAGVKDTTAAWKLRPKPNAKVEILDSTQNPGSLFAWFSGLILD